MVLSSIEKRPFELIKKKNVSHDADIFIKTVMRSFDSIVVECIGMLVVVEVDTIILVVVGAI